MMPLPTSSLVTQLPGTLPRLMTIVQTDEAKSVRSHKLPSVFNVNILELVASPDRMTLLAAVGTYRIAEPSVSRVHVNLSLLTRSASLLFLQQALEVQGSNRISLLTKPGSEMTNRWRSHKSRGL